MSSLYKLFVYGTLKRGQPNHYFFSETKGVARLLGTARLVEKYPLVVTEYGIPILLAKKGEGKVCVLFTVRRKKLTLHYFADSRRRAVRNRRDHTSGGGQIGESSAHCHIITPPPQSHTSHLAQSAPVTSAQDTVECQIYLFYDYTEESLTKPHFDSYDYTELPEGIPSNERSEQLKVAVYESIRKIKKKFHTK